MDSQTFRERIIQSTAAKRMIETVSPIYEDAYVGCWLFEDIGREWDRLWEIIDELPDQLMPECTTWCIELWEKRYGIKPDDTKSLEARRQRVIEMRDRLRNVSLYRLEKWLEEQSKGKARIIDNVAPYTFGIEINAYDGMASLNTPEAVAYINQRKPSHLSYRIDFKSERKLKTYIGTALYNALKIKMRMADVDFDALQSGCLYDETDAMLIDENGIVMTD